jgi:hypothetical protein
MIHLKPSIGFISVPCLVSLYTVRIDSSDTIEDVSTLAQVHNLSLLNCRNVKKGLEALTTVYFLHIDRVTLQHYEESIILSILSQVHHVVLQRYWFLPIPNCFQLTTFNLIYRSKYSNLSSLTKLNIIRPLITDSPSKLSFFWLSGFFHFFSSSLAVVISNLPSLLRLEVCSSKLKTELTLDLQFNSLPKLWYLSLFQCKLASSVTSVDGVNLKVVKMEEVKTSTVCSLFIAIPLNILWLKNCIGVDFQIQHPIKNYSQIITSDC